MNDDFHSNLIRSFGGKAKLAEALGLDRAALTKWHVRGIPARYWPRVEALARERGLAISGVELERTKPRLERAA